MTDILQLDTAEAFLIPTEQSSVMLPHFEPETLSRLKRDGWARLGLVAAVLDERQHLLMLSHKQSDKTPAGALGPLAETSQISQPTEGSPQVETVAHTLARGIKEELGVSDPSELELTGRRFGAWLLNAWPVGTQYATETALAICPVVHISKERRESLLDTFTETEEIDGIKFMPLDDVATEKAVRPGTHAWLKSVGASDLLDPYGYDRVLVELPEPTPLTNAVDIKFKNLHYL